MARGNGWSDFKDQLLAVTRWQPCSPALRAIFLGMKTNEAIDRRQAGGYNYQLEISEFPLSPER
jgi:hypothetical protein